MEMADSILISKADGENTKKANLARLDYKNALHLFPPNKNQWIPKVETLSSLDNHGIEKIWTIISDFKDLTSYNGSFLKVRSEQQKYWMNESLKEKVLNDFYLNPDFLKLKDKYEQGIDEGDFTSFQAAELLYQKIKEQ